MNTLPMFSKKKLWQIVALPVAPAAALYWALAPSVALAGNEPMTQDNSKSPGEYQAMDQRPLRNDTDVNGYNSREDAMHQQNRQTGTDSEMRNSQNSQSRSPEFSQVDTNNDEQLIWTEIYAIYDDEMDRAEWTEERVFSTYDTNKDSALDNREYDLFVTSLVAYPGTRSNSDRPQSSINEQEAMKAANNSQMRESTNRDSDQSGDNRFSSTRERDEGASGDLSESQLSAGRSTQSRAQDRVDHRSEPEVFSNAPNSQPSQPSESSSPADAVTTVISVTTVTEVPVDQLEDMEVINMSGDSIGEVEEVLTENDGTISALVVGVGGFWDIGDKDVRVDVEDLRLSGDYIVWETALDEDQLDDLPQYEGEELSAAF